MNNKKISFILAAAIAAAASQTAFGFDSDISGHWAKDSFIRLENIGIINGYEDGSYRPEDNITRAEFFTMINRAANVSKNKGAAFTDIAPGAWYRQAAELASGSGYASGYEDGTFRGEENITRAEAAAAVVKAFGGDFEKTAEFSDSGSIPEWAEEYIDILAESGVISGDENGAFRAEDYITRAEAAAIFDRIIGERYTMSENLSDYTFENKVLICGTDIIFENVTFNGDITIGPGVSGGEIRFLNCRINGSVYISGRDGSSVVFENTDCKKICINSTDEATVILTGTSEIENIVVRSAAGIAEMNAEKGAKNILSYAKTELLGSFEAVDVRGGAGIALTGGEIKTLIISADSRPSIDINGKADDIKAEKPCVINGRSVSAGGIQRVDSSADSDTELSYTLARLTGRETDDNPLAGGTRTEARADTDYALSGIEVSGGKISPEFAPSVTEYKITAPIGGSVTIIPKKDESLECKAGGKAIDKLSVSDYSASGKTVSIDVYDGIAKKNTYRFTVEGYGTDDTRLESVTLSRESKLTESGGAYSFVLDGNIDYSSGSILAELYIVPVNEKSVVKIDGNVTSTYTFDLYSEKKKSVSVTVTSEDGTNESVYTVSVERPHISEIDDPNSEAVERIFDNPSAMTEEDIALSKLYGYNSEKKSKYAGYLSQISYHAEGGDVFAKQELIQKAINVVNEYDGKKIRLEAEDNFKDEGWGQTRDFSDGGKCIISSEFYAKLNLPEGRYSMNISTASAWWSLHTVKVLLNGSEVYSGSSGKTIGNPGAAFASTAFSVGTGAITLPDGENILTTEKVSNLLIDYIELEMNF